MCAIDKYLRNPNRPKEYEYERSVQHHFWYENYVDKSVEIKLDLLVGAPCYLVVEIAVSVHCDYTHVELQVSVAVEQHGQKLY